MLLPGNYAADNNPLRRKSAVDNNPKNFYIVAKSAKYAHG